MLTMSTPEVIATDNPPGPGKVSHTTRVYNVPYTLFYQWCGFFYVPQEPDK